ncbi:MAG: PqqD family peptide modification chaperone [Actinomycetota bacterium]|nr:PqqD family peptide modification chaperone [Actinomycetota bacterium]
MTLSLRSQVRAAPEQVSSDVAGETVILELGRGVYYGLADVGARVWELLREPRTVGEIRDIVVSEYDVEPERAGADLLSLLAEMQTRELVEVRDEEAP